MKFPNYQQLLCSSRKIDHCHFNAEEQTFSDFFFFSPSKNYSEHQERSLFSKYKPGHFITIPHNLKFETIDNLSVKLNDY